MQGDNPAFGINKLRPEGIHATYFTLVKPRAEFLALVLLSLMVLHNPAGTGMEAAMAEVATRATAEEELSAQVSSGNTDFRFWGCFCLCMRYFTRTCRQA